MKKSLLVLGMAVAALASCTNEEVMEVAENRAISFAGSGIDNITKADITSTTFRTFKVYGGYDETDLFKGTDVTKSGSNWTYTPAQYWAVGSWRFAGYAGGDGVSPTWSYDDGLTLEVNSDASHQSDVVYAASSEVEITDDDLATYDTPVSLNFTHLLSKLAFKFTKDAQTLGGVTVTMSNFKVAAITTAGKWIAGTQQSVESAATGDYTDGLGIIDATNGVQTAWFYVIPQNVTAFAITADVLVEDGAGTTIKDGTISTTVPTSGDGVITKWDAQKQYLYTANITMANIDDDDPDAPEPTPIKFTGSASDWDNTVNNGTVTFN